MADMTSNKPGLIVTIDDKACSLDTSDIATFKELIHKIELELIPEGRVLTHIYLNGEFLTGEQEELFSGFGIENISTLDVKTAEPVELALTSLNDTLDYLPELAGMFENAAKQIRRGEYNIGLTLLEESLELVQSFNHLLDGIRKVLMIDFFQIPLEDDEGKNFAGLNNKLNELANEILKAGNTENWSELADLLEYELSPLLYRYLGAMPYVIEAVHNRDKKSN